jgi:hypothetical protein
MASVLLSCVFSLSFAPLLLGKYFADFHLATGLQEVPTVFHHPCQFNNTAFPCLFIYKFGIGVDGVNLRRSQTVFCGVKLLLHVLCMMEVPCISINGGEGGELVLARFLINCFSNCV